MDRGRNDRTPKHELFTLKDIHLNPNRVDPDPGLNRPREDNPTPESTNDPFGGLSLGGLSLADLPEGIPDFGNQDPRDETPLPENEAPKDSGTTEEKANNEDPDR